MIYDVNGNELNSVYDVNGQSLQQAYDIDGNELMSQSPVTLTVMSYNSQWLTGANADADLISGIISTYDPDIIGYQEFAKNTVTTIPSKYYQLSPNTPYIQMSTYGNRNAIASKFALGTPTTVPFTIQTMDGQATLITTANIGGRTITLMSSHTTYGRNGDSYTQKVSQNVELFDLVEQYDNVILFADLNTACKDTSDKEYTDIMKNWVDAGYHCANCTEEFGFMTTYIDGHLATGTSYPTDHIITSPNIIINSVTVDQAKIAYCEEHQLDIDHLPVIASITIGADEYDVELPYNPNTPIDS